MAGATDYLEDKFANHLLNNTSFTSPANIYLGLFTVAPTDSTSGTECTGGSYARVSASYAASSGGAASLDATSTFPTATGSWGTVVAWGLFDASSAGNLLAYSTVTPNMAVPSGATPKFLAGQCAISVD